jgi:hypothetical protein
MDDHLIRTIVVLADDLIWSSRLAEAVRRGGGQPVVLTTSRELDIALEAQDVGDEPALSGVIVDMGARRLDAVAAIERVSAARLPVIAVAQHDDQVTRKRASTAGASRVFSYGKFFVDGTGIVERWLVAAGTASSSAPPTSAATSASRHSA